VLRWVAAGGQLQCTPLSAPQCPALCMCSGGRGAAFSLRQGRTAPRAAKPALAQRMQLGCHLLASIVATLLTSGQSCGARGRRQSPRCRTTCCVVSSIKSTPKLNKSAAKVHRAPISTSGAAYRRLPPMAVRAALPSTWAKPRSAKQARWSSDSSTLLQGRRGSRWGAFRMRCPTSSRASGGGAFPALPQHAWAASCKQPTWPSNRCA
jgi:hypothetical protein